MKKRIGEFAEELNMSKEELKELSRNLNLLRIMYTEEEQQVIKNYIKDKEDNEMEKNKNQQNGLNITKKQDTKELTEKEEQLKKFYEKIKQENDKLNQEKLEFESYKKSEQTKLKENLLTEELNHKTKLEEKKIKILTQLSDEFLENIKHEYNSIKIKLDEVTQKEKKLIQWNQELEESEKAFTQEKKLFDSKKEELLVKYKEELELEKKKFFIEEEKLRVNNIGESRKEIEKLYLDKDLATKEKEDLLIERESILKANETEFQAKEKSLINKEANLYKQVNEKVSQEIKDYQDRISHDAKIIDKLKDERMELINDLNEAEKFEGRELATELDEKIEEINLLKQALDDMTSNKNRLEVELQKNNTEFNKEKEDLRREIQLLKDDNLKVQTLEQNNFELEDKLKSTVGHLAVVQGQRDQTTKKLESIYSTGKEQEEREKEIKKVKFNKKALDKDYKEIKPNTEIEYLDSIHSYMNEYKVTYSKRLLYAFHTALKSADYSPLSVLSGVSGTGKSELPKLYSHFGGFNFLSEAVQPTWDSPESLMGYFNAIDNKFDSTNILKFLLQTSQSKNEDKYGWKESMNMILLDEMNLSHIELYFAEFLSKFEQRRGTKGVDLNIKLGTGMIMPLPLDNNTLWIGTMNEDETTKSLSDKVLDRAFSINFPRPDQLKSRNVIKPLDEIKEFEYLHRDTWNSWIQKESIFTKDNYKIIEDYKDITNHINKELSTTGKAIGHRVWQSMEYYIQNHPRVIQSKDDDNELSKYVKLAFEEQLVQKVMPKLRGIETHGEENKVLKNIENMLIQEEFGISEDFSLAMDNPYGQFIWNSANYLLKEN